MKKPQKRSGIISNILLMAFCILWLYPVYIIIVNSFKSRSEMYANSLALPSELSLQYYTAAFAKMNINNSTQNTGVLTISPML